MDIYLETERLILRRFTTDDVDNLVDLDSDPEVMRYINGGIPTPREAIEHDFLPTFLAYYQRGDRYGFWAAIEKATGDFLGWFHFRPAPDTDPDEPELGYRLKRSAWGRGYASEASRALIDKGFIEFDVRRVVASACAANIASRRIMEKVGMTLVRTYRFESAGHSLDGADVVEYALERADWSGGEV